KREEVGGKTYFLVQDSTLGHDSLVSQAAVDAEASGYFLVLGKSPPQGFRRVEDDEAKTVWGRGNAPNKDPEGSSDGDDKSGSDQGSCHGMARYAVHSMLVSLNIVDTPVGYAPPVGPGVLFTVTYNQRDAFQPAVFTYANLGPKWTFDWLSYVTDD